MAMQDERQRQPASHLLCVLRSMQEHRLVCSTTAAFDFTCSDFGLSLQRHEVALFPMNFDLSKLDKLGKGKKQPAKAAKFTPRFLAKQASLGTLGCVCCR
jgi:hypothetical protein